MVILVSGSPCQGITVATYKGLRRRTSTRSVVFEVITAPLERAQCLWGPRLVVVGENGGSITSQAIEYLMPTLGFTGAQLHVEISSELDLTR